MLVHVYYLISNWTLTSAQCSSKEFELQSQSRATLECNNSLWDPQGFASSIIVSFAGHNLIDLERVHPWNLLLKFTMTVLSLEKKWLLLSDSRHASLRKYMSFCLHVCFLWNKKYWSVLLLSTLWWHLNQCNYPKWDPTSRAVWNWFVYSLFSHGMLHWWRLMSQKHTSLLAVCLQFLTFHALII